MWKQINGYENYEVSEEGQVRNIKTGKILKAFERQGYMRVKLTKDKKGYTASVHRLIAEAFISNPENKPFIDHIDRNRNNNNILNLRWATSCENAQNQTQVDNAVLIHCVYRVEIQRNKKIYRKEFKKLEDAEAYLEELKSTIIINGIE
jgi:hypothetical protein